MVADMINRKESVHLQDFPDVSNFSAEEQLVSDMDLVRVICSTALAIRDNKNLRVRLPLQSLMIIGKNVDRIKPFLSVIAEEVNIKRVDLEENIADFAELKLQINFKKIGAKFGHKMKEISQAIKDSSWQKISEKEISIAGVNLINDEFELKLTSKAQNEEKFIIVALPTNDYLVRLDVEVTQDLEEEGIARDIVRLIQQNRRDADLKVSDYISLRIFCGNQRNIEIIKKFETYIAKQVLAKSVEYFSDENSIKSSSKFFFENDLDEEKFLLGIGL
jgi:isoleucyl-tRNA synthetase